MNSSRRSGFIKLILLVIVAVLALSYFGFSFRNIVNSPTGQDNLSFLREIGDKIWAIWLNFWHSYLREPIIVAWQFIWDKFGQIRSYIK